MARCKEFSGRCGPFPFARISARRGPQYMFGISWPEIHGALTHFPVALLITAAIFETGAHSTLLCAVASDRPAPAVHRPDPEYRQVVQQDERQRHHRLVNGIGRGGEDLLTLLLPFSLDTSPPKAFCSIRCTTYLRNVLK